MAAVVALAAGALAPGGLEAQARGAAGQDTLTTEQRIAERLRLLDRPPGIDSATISADSARLAGRQQAQQRATLGTDSIMEALLGLEGYDVTQYAGTSATWDARNSRLLLVGDSTRRAETLMNDGTRMTADTIDYDQEAGEADLLGAPVVIPSQGEELSARRMRFNTESEIGVAQDARTRVTEGGEWNIRGDLREISPNTTYGSHLMFTSCDEEDPHYHFAATEYKWTRGGTIVARDVTLYFADVPVFKLPFIAQNTRSGRSSGILAPRFSVNDIVRSSGGYRRRISNVGYYWAMSDYSDATIALDWFDQNYTAITGSVRYNWLRQFLQGSLDFRQYWRAAGGTETTFNTRHSWTISERTSFNANAAYATSTSFITDNSFNPQEVTQTIESQGGLSHRFDWGQLNLSGNRRQYLSDDRVEQTLPQVTLSLSTITLLPAPSATARWYNNLTWGGSAGFSLRTSDFSQELEPTRFDQATMAFNAGTSLNLGNLRVSGSAKLEEQAVKDVQRDSLDFFPGTVADLGLAAFETDAWRRELGRLSRANGELVDVTSSSLTWSTTVDYQQTLIGSTTLTPQVRFSGSALRADDEELAQSFVAAPSRVTFGATLKSDIYGFYPGFGGFERLRHKLTPSITYDWSPETRPDSIQEEVFGSRTRLPTNVVALTLNQTFEAKRPAPEEAEGAGGGEGEPDFLGEPGAAAGGSGGLGDPDEPRRLQQGEIVNLLSLRTSVLRYSFVDDEDAPTNSFLNGFETTRISNQISSDFLRGLSISMAHELFEEVPIGETGQTERRFDPHLAQMNLGFQLSNRSAIFRWLGFGGGDGEDEPDEDEIFDELEAQDQLLQDDPLGMPGTDETSIVPGGSRSGANRSASSSASGVGEWSANLSYALTRPRDGAISATSSVLQANLRLKPTEQWEMSWNTSYDLERNAFNDHTIRLSRDLHRWRANFDFLQTATGNWTFRFEVSLIDNRDLNFDYQQRNTAATQRNRR